MKGRRPHKKQKHNGAPRQRKKCPVSIKNSPVRRVPGREISYDTEKLHPAAFLHEDTALD